MNNYQHISTQMTQIKQILADFFNNLCKSVKSASSACKKNRNKIKISRALMGVRRLINCSLAVTSAYSLVIYSWRMADIPYIIIYSHRKRNHR